eukprot:TRINITY_DN20114_c0_g1_i1.p1 TRINITY_DN20114_c0_g1~~TRINITY_DN20114_c0_g1_i1.p1  ORF type:complete len:230 (-),score=39.11 TRINITY_DN20114_c0_g1_i1:107-796(-)
MDLYREPCPHRIVTDMGGAFAMGAIGGTLFHGIKGAWTAPAGERIISALHGIRSRAPITGGSFAVWGGLYSSFDCILSGVRRREDPFNSIGAGALTGGVLAARSGWRVSLRSAFVGGLLLALIEGVAMIVQRQSNEPPLPTLESEKTGWMSGLSNKIFSSDKTNEAQKQQNLLPPLDTTLGEYSGFDDNTSYGDSGLAGLGEYDSGYTFDEPTFETQMGEGYDYQRTGR